MSEFACSLEQDIELITPSIGGTMANAMLLKLRSERQRYEAGLAEVRAALERFSPLVQHGPEDYRIRATALAKLDALMGEK